MSHKIARLLDEPEPMVTKALAALEEKNGGPSHDARFIAETTQAIRQKLSLLELDPEDTTGEELYHALLVKFHKDSKLFDIYFGAAAMDFDRKSALAVKVITASVELPKRWALKSPAAKDILRQQPPKRTMKHLGYRSVESMLKRETAAEIYLGCQYLEAAVWKKAVDRAISKLDQACFELKPIKPQALAQSKWPNIYGPDNFVAQDNNIGAIGLWPAASLQDAPFLTDVVLITERIYAYENVHFTSGLAGLNKVIQWWADMDHLIADLDTQPVSLSLKDAAVNAMQANPFSQRTLEHGRASFWKELVSRYANIPEAEAMFDSRVREKIIQLRHNIPQPAYEFLEEI